MQVKIKGDPKPLLQAFADFAYAGYAAAVDAVADKSMSPKQALASVRTAVSRAVEASDALHDPDRKKLSIRIRPDASPH